MPWPWTLKALGFMALQVFAVVDPQPVLAAVIKLQASPRFSGPRLSDLTVLALNRKVASLTMLDGDTGGTNSNKRPERIPLVKTLRSASGILKNFIHGSPEIRTQDQSVKSRVLYR